MGSNNSQAQSSSQNNSRCRATGCKENHTSHFCKQCQNKDSDHFSGACPSLIKSNNSRNPNQPNISGGSCKVNGCNENHRAHFCRNCKDSDSNHFRRDCPQGYNQQSILDGNYPFRVNPNTDYGKTQYRKSFFIKENDPENQLNQDNQAYQFLRKLAAINPQIALHVLQNIQSESQDSDSQNSGVHCRVKGCRLQHQQHNCRMCQNNDVDHFQDNCPVRKSKEQAYRSTMKLKTATQKQKMKCKANKCQQNHAHHYCGNCKAHDTDHRARSCPKVQGNKQNCRAIGCGINHDKHYCKICEVNDVDHVARNCPKGITVYHGTTEDCAKAIQKSKMQPSKFGNLGAGIYFTPVKQAAVGIAKLRQTQQKNGKKQKSVLIIAKLKKKEGHYKQRIHGPWRDAYQKDFLQIAVANDQYLRIEGYQYVS